MVGKVADRKIVTHFLADGAGGGFTDGGAFGDAFFLTVKKFLRGGTFSGQMMMIVGVGRVREHHHTYPYFLYRKQSIRRGV